MNHITKRNRLMAHIDSFSEFLRYCDQKSKMKLINEIAKMRQQVEVIKCMTLSELQEQVQEYIDVKESKLNYSNELITL